MTFVGRGPLWFLFITMLVLSGCQQRRVELPASPPPAPKVVAVTLANASPELRAFLASAAEQTKITTGYDPSYVALKYPGGDVPPETGVCSDVLVRAFRKAGLDLQKAIHEDMTAAWSAYPRQWGARRPDSNIDHRRVPNLMTYFERRGKALSQTTNRDDYLPGDIVAWDLGRGVEHIGIVSDHTSEPDSHLLIIHNIGAGTRAEDVLLNWKIIGHYRFF